MLRCKAAEADLGRYGSDPHERERTCSADGALRVAPCHNACHAASCVRVFLSFPGRAAGLFSLSEARLPLRSSISASVPTAGPPIGRREDERGRNHTRVAARMHGCSRARKLEKLRAVTFASWHGDDVLLARLLRNAFCPFFPSPTRLHELKKCPTFAGVVVQQAVQTQPEVALDYYTSSYGWSCMEVLAQASPCSK